MMKNWQKLLVLKSSYDWLLFMSDAMIKFVTDLLIDPNLNFLRLVMPLLLAIDPEKGKHES